MKTKWIEVLFIRFLEFLIIVIFIFIASIMAGCSSTWHLKQSEKHYNKAIFKGYEPNNDFKEVTKDLPPLEVNFSDSIRQTYIKAINGLIIKENPLNTTIQSERNQYKNRAEILNYKIDSILQNIPKDLTLDTVVRYGDSLTIKTELKNGKFYQSVKTRFPQKTIYINPLDDFLQKIRSWQFLTGIILFFIFFIAYKLLKNY